MRLYLQWAKNPPEPWVAVDLTASGGSRFAWRNLAKKAEPTGGELLDSTAGWINDICLHGVTHSGYDHYAVIPRADGGLDVTMWNDDPAEFPPGEKWVLVTSYWPLRDAGLRLDEMGRLLHFAADQLPPRLTRTYYAEPLKLARLQALVAEADNGNPSGAAGITVLPWSLWSPPAANLTRHGIWLSDVQYQQHRTAQRPYPPWQEP